jgi:hypothetical protein
MCSVSAIISDFQLHQPPLPQWPLPALLEAQRVIQLLESIDKRLEARDCYEPTKADFVKSLEARIIELERAQRPA